LKTLSIFLSVQYLQHIVLVIESPANAGISKSIPEVLKIQDKARQRFFGVRASIITLASWMFLSAPAWSAEVETID
jgi:hypothetical protein